MSDADNKATTTVGKKPKRIYPGERQILRYLRIEQDNKADGSVEVRTPVLPDLLDAGGAMRLGAIAPMCDVAAGSMAASLAHPDWVATLDFKFHLGTPVLSGMISGHCHPLRIGKNTVVSETQLSGPDGETAGMAIVTFTRLPQREDQKDKSPPRVGPYNYSLDYEEPRIPLDQYLGIRFESDQHAFELDHHERIYNSFGSIQGGAMAALLERGASYAAERVLACPARTVDLHFSYTAQARVGPFRVTAKIVRNDTSGVLSRVELIDTGMDNRVSAIGTALAVPIAD
ncbi:MAG: hypothetical protein KUG79_15630 [Pseudomonadales bacterium]|nr:hypothetical protein [Pseudomonadales bacterium]